MAKGDACLTLVLLLAALLFGTGLFVVIWPLDQFVADCALQVILIPWMCMAASPAQPSSKALSGGRGSSCIPSYRLSLPCKFQ